MAAFGDGVMLVSEFVHEVGWGDLPDVVRGQGRRLGGGGRICGLMGGRCRRRGRRLDSGQIGPKWDGAEPPSDEELLGKFR